MVAIYACIGTAGFLVGVLLMISGGLHIGSGLIAVLLGTGIVALASVVEQLVFLRKELTGATHTHRLHARSPGTPKPKPDAAAPQSRNPHF